MSLIAVQPERVWAVKAPLANFLLTSSQSVGRGFMLVLGMVVDQADDV